MQDFSCNILGFRKNGIWKTNFFHFIFCFFFLNPRCLLIDLVHWVKRELKTFKKKKFTGFDSSHSFCLEIRPNIKHVGRGTI